VALVSAVAKPLHPEGRRFVAGFAAATVLLFLLSPWAGAAGLVLTVWCYTFFRDPPRVTPGRPGLIVSPADGLVSMIAPAAPPPELGLGAAPRTRISIFMNVFDCHVNRAPVGGRVERVAYHPGRFLNAALDKASEANERNGLVIELDGGRSLAVVQIAGLVARRIVCFVREGARLETGERFGLIRFGSRLDVYLPDGTAPLVCPGQAAIAGETVIADLAATEAPRTGVVR
jgi:phosphatidylserine decarboxylase